jgi:penicillin-binding protein 1C
VKKPRKRRVLVAVLLLAGLWVLLRGGWLAPEEPGDLLRARYASTRLLDRHGRPLRAFTGDLHTRARSVPLAEVSPHLIAATLAAEDQRFWQHPGVDPVAIVRAAAGNVRHGRVTSGASTLTQQLVKLMQPRPRDAWHKTVEAVVALHLEHTWDKRQILQWYLDFAPYGGLLRGCEEAARTLFGKPARDLTLAEAAYLAVLPRSPTTLDPLVHPERALPLQRRLLQRMRDRQVIDAAAYQTALAQPMRIAVTPLALRAPHFAEWVADQLGPLMPKRPIALRTTLDGALQQDLQVIVARHLQALRDRQVGNAAVVVLDNATRELRAMVGSADYADLQHLGANNGATALRQPGSTMKAFTFATAFDLGLTAATVLPDLPAQFQTEQGPWSPQNYGHQWLGPVRARLALANSVNMAAVQMLAQVGVPALRNKLAALGFRSLAQGAAHYGLGLTLGDGEVTLLELATAYATLARGGMHRPMHWLDAVVWPDGPVVVAPEPERRVFTEQAAWLTADVLADPQARELAFGRHGALELPFPTLTKTGTSKGFRDNWAVGSTPRWTVAVWVGNFDGTPMRGVSGVTGAGPLLHDALLRVVGDEPPTPFARPATLQQAKVCALSGGLATEACPQAVHEWLAPGTLPPPCTWHVVAQGQTWAILPPPYQTWAREHLPHPPQAQVGKPEGTRIEAPADGAVYFVDSLRPRESQQIALVAHGQDPADVVRWEVDGQAVGSVRSGERLLWPVVEGRHRLVARALRGGVARVVVVVRGAMRGGAEGE